ncbi:hypothetical protein Taro_004923 [Colocasia esculenta]|uniref:Uncharacterized protein n=1 Tax=Colocasia esculenta TaxID=4460 RepID=A0A843TRM0_COLES|nr:hypothetical protein [Colocasia esculenta]
MKAPYSFKKEHTKRLFDLCLDNQLISLPEPKKPADVSKINQPNYCPYHRMVGHPIENCYVFKNEVQKMIQEGLISMQTSLVDPPQPHAWGRPGQFVNVIHMTELATNSNHIDVDPPCNPPQNNSGAHSPLRSRHDPHRKMRRVQRQTQRLQQGQQELRQIVQGVERRQDTPAQIPCAPQIVSMHAQAQIYPEPPPMSPYTDPIGWLSEGPSTSVESARLYSFPRHQTFSLFRLCLQSGLMNYLAPVEILTNYCPYHQMMGHSIEDCIRFKDDVQRLIRQGIISLGVHQVNPPQPHTQQLPDGPANPGSHSVNVINASSSSGLPQSTLEEPSNPYLSSQCYTDARPLQQRSFAIKNTKLTFDNLRRQSLVTIFEPAPYIFQSEKEMHDYYCPDLHDLIETHIREGKIDQYGNSLAPTNEVSRRKWNIIRSCGKANLAASRGVRG